MGFAVLGACDSKPEKNELSTPAETIESTAVVPPPKTTTAPASQPHSPYAGSDSCRSCHEEIFETWRGSHHALAERLIDPRRDRDAFVPEQTITHGTIHTTFRERDGRFEIVTVGGDGERQPFAPVRVIAESPLRQFLIPTEGGRLQVSGVAFDPERGDWFDVFGAEDRRPHEWGFWANRGMNWNSMCADCHNTGLQKGYDAATDTYHTTYSELGIGCEACHGPSRAHVEWRRAHPESEADPTAPTMPTETVMALCGSCHARRVTLTDGYRVGDRFLDHYRPALPDHTELFYPDGQIREEVYEYTSFLLSRMYLKGVRCTDCHEQTSGRMLATGNDLCLRCHGSRPDPQWKLPYQLDAAAHSHHDPNGPGGRCVDCHMPITVYMQRDPRHDHGMTIPDPLLTREHGIPNACNRCHTDKSVDWAIEAVDRWYGDKMDRITRRRTRHVARARGGDETVVGALIDHARTEEIGGWRAVMARLLERWVDRPEVTETLLGLLRDDDALVRTEAIGALEAMARPLAPAIVPLLDDPVRAVRVQAAWALRAAVPLSHPAARELQAYLALNADQPAGAVMLGTFHNDRGESMAAVEAFRRAVRFESNGVPQRHALAVALSAAALQADQAGQSALATNYRTEAIEHLRLASELSPQDAELAHGLGLALAEVNQYASAVQWLERACALDPTYVRAAYNLGLAYHKTGDLERAAASLRRAESLAPQQAEYAYALATVLRQLGRTDEAREAAERALRIDPNHEAAAQLLRESQRPAQ